MRHVARRSRCLLVTITLMACLVALSSCALANGGKSSHEVDMGGTEFLQSSITITAGQSVQFVDPAKGGGVHVLCIGKDSTCAPQAGAPPVLSATNGVQMMPGDPPLEATFPMRGTYVVVCTIHPGMAVTVKVQ